MNSDPFGIEQPSGGYRYGIDSFLLARFARFKEKEKVCDLGAGVGVLSLLALLRGKVKFVKAVEVQSHLCEWAEKNRKKFKQEEKMEVLCLNWKEIPNFLKSRSFDLIISNPPYRKIKTGKLCPNEEKAVAKHEILGNLSTFLEASRFLVTQKGRICLVYPVLRLEEVFLEFQKYGFKPTRLSFIHPYLGRSATHFLIEGKYRSTEEIKIEAPVVIYRDENRYTEEIENWIYHS